MEGTDLGENLGPGKLPQTGWKEREGERKRVLIKPLSTEAGN